MFSLNQIRELIFLYLFRSDLKLNVDTKHPQRMDEIKEYAVSVDNKLPAIVASISSERKTIQDQIEAIKYEENQFRLRCSLDMQD